MTRQIIASNKAPSAIGTYSQAVKVDNTVYLSGQIPLLPETMELCGNEIEAQIIQVFTNLQAVAEAADGSLADIVKLNILLTNLKHFPLINEIMTKYFKEPYPARAVIGVAELPKGSQVEMDAIMVLAD